MFDEQGRALRKVAEGFVETGAHSVAVNQRTHEIYLPLANVAEQPVLRIALLAPPRK